MDLLQLCAQKYAELCYYTYDCTIARKNTAIDLHFTFRLTSSGIWPVCIG